MSMNRLKVTGAGAAGPRNSALALLLGPKVEAVIWRRVARREIRKDLGAGKEAARPAGLSSSMLPRPSSSGQGSGGVGSGGGNHSAP